MKSLENSVSSNWETGQGSDMDYEYSNDQQMWQRTTLLTDKAVQFATAKTCLFRFSARSGRHQSRSRHFRELDRMPMEFEWNISQDSPH